MDEERPEDEPLMLTPGPATLSMRVKRAMLHDYASGEQKMLDAIAFSRRYILDLCNGAGTHTAVPIVGSGTSGNEAAIGTLVPENGKLLIHTNGVYGDRLVEIARKIRVPYTSFRTAPFTPPTAKQFEEMLVADAAITHVMIVHCETSTGILNPIEEVAALCKRRGIGLLIDAVASFGAFALDAKKLGYDAVVCSANKGLQAPPGLAWVVAKKTALEATKGNAPSLTLDLWDQDQHMERTGMFRFTPGDASAARHGRGAARARRGRRHRGPPGPLPRKLAPPGGRHAPDGLQDAAGGRRGVAHRRHLPRPAGPELQLPEALRRDEAAGLHHLPWAAGGREHLPARLHRHRHGTRHRTGAGRDGGDPERDGGQDDGAGGLTRYAKAHGIMTPEGLHHPS
jgi:hypothetical protein